MHSQSEPLLVLQALRTKANHITGVNAENGFELQKVIVEHDFQPGPEVLVNWKGFDDIDRIALSDLSKHFGAIWYPSSDDIEIFDESLSWFVLVRHDGHVSALNLSFSSR